MSLNHFQQARIWLAKSLASLLACFVLAVSVPTLAFAQAASAPAAATAAATPPANVVSEEAVENPFGLRGSWQSSDWVKRTTMIILVIMSVASWYVIFVKLFEQHAMLKSGRADAEIFWKSNSVKAGLSSLQEGSALRFIAEQGIKAADHHEGTMVESIDKHTWIAMSVERAVGNVQSRLSSGLALLATVGSTSPFVGLFGTTWGIYEALVKIGLSGQASIDKVAGPVGAALLLTAIGLVVAVPAVMGYNWLVRRNKTVLDQTRAFAGDLQNVLLSGKR
jgi:biopolymer transport protein ExbB